MAIVLGFAVYMSESSLLHVRKLQASNLELEKEIAGREQAEEALRQAQKIGGCRPASRWRGSRFQQRADGDPRASFALVERHWP